MIRLPVRRLVELIMRSGDIASGYAAPDRMAAGAEAHRALQRQNRQSCAQYRSEVHLAAHLSCQGFDYLLEGRADGIFQHEGLNVVEEIKTTLIPLESFQIGSHPAHWAQAQCYAYILALQHDLAEIMVQLTYLNLDGGEVRSFMQKFTSLQLEEFVQDLLAQYSVWARYASQWVLTRDASLQDLAFPFDRYRPGQRELAVQTYKTILHAEKLYVQAPTGIGKTISVIYPALKAMGEGKTSKIFYLTAKTITRQAALEALNRMQFDGLKLKTVVLTAKEKLCFCDEPVCQPEFCDYARGHYDRINAAILDAIQGIDLLSRSVIEAYARQHRVCPFELSLDISLLADCVICDYNYVFDPRAYLRRFFSEGSNDYVFLIDEAHNLVDRGREMFSAQLAKTDFYRVKKGCQGLSKSLDKILTSINRHFIKVRKECGHDHFRTQTDLDQPFVELLDKYALRCSALLKKNRQLIQDKDFMHLFFQVQDFLAKTACYAEGYRTLLESAGAEVTVKLFCLDPSQRLREGLGRGRAAIFFSATLSPLGYFRDILGGGDGDRILSLPSPYDRNNLCVMIADRVSTKYQDREQTSSQVVELIATFVGGKTGNYMVYFPSYKYMQAIFSEFMLKFPHINAVAQEQVLTEIEREEFVDRFTDDPAETYVAFCVLGGIFSEGIDLAGNRLLGAVIVSVGLPQLSLQQDIIRDYFDQNKGRGYEYAYMYPGMVKVLQAAGRVIRSETDRGAILLIDQRYGRRNYLQLFPAHWSARRTAEDAQRVRYWLQCFWASASGTGDPPDAI